MGAPVTHLSTLVVKKRLEPTAGSLSTCNTSYICQPPVSQCLSYAEDAWQDRLVCMTSSLEGQQGFQSDLNFHRVYMILHAV